MNYLTLDEVQTLLEQEEDNELRLKLAVSKKRTRKMLRNNKEGKQWKCSSTTLTTSLRLQTQRLGI